MSDRRTFIIVLDVLNPAVDLSKIKALIKTSSSFRGWWNHIPGCFLVTSERSAQEITNEIMEESGDSRLLVMEVNPRASEGWLPEQSWDWVRRLQTENAN